MSDSDDAPEPIPEEAAIPDEVVDASSIPPPPELPPPAWVRAIRTYDRLRAAAVRVTMRLAPTETQRVLGLTIVLGGICGLVAVLFHLAIHATEHFVLGSLSTTSTLGLLGLGLAPAVGGLVAGAALRWFPNARGSGVPQVKVAYAVDTARVRLRDAIAKFGLCVVQLGFGASLGREGPTVQICTAVATSAGRWLALSPANLRRLIPVGAAAGIAAAFNAPIAAVTFTIEEIVGGLDQTVLSGVVVAAALAAVVEHSVLGANPIFSAPENAGLHHPTSLPFYALLGLGTAFVSVGFYDLLLGMRKRFRAQQRIPVWAQPAVGGLLTGVLGALTVYLVDEPGIEGGGYETLGDALHGSLALHVLGVLCLAKLLAAVFSYSSGGAGGIFAPVLFIGAMFGGLVGGLDVAVLGHDPDVEMSSFALVGMGALFAAVIRAPITSVLIIFEMTGNYDLVLPLMIANSAAYVLSRRMRPQPLYEALLAQDDVHLPHGVEVRARLASICVEEAMTRELVVIPAETPIEEAAQLAARHRFSTYPVLDGERFIGLLSEARMLRTLAEKPGQAVTAAEVARRKEYAIPDEPLLRAVARMNRLGVRQLPVLARSSHELLGLVSMSDVLRAQAQFAEEHHLPEVAREIAIDGQERPSLLWLPPTREGERPSGPPDRGDQGSE